MGGVASATGRCPFSDAVERTKKAWPKKRRAETPKIAASRIRFILISAKLIFLFFRRADVRLVALPPPLVFFRSIGEQDKDRPCHCQL